MNTKVFTPGFSLASIFAMLLVAGGCQDIQKRTYEVSVHNESDRPVTVRLCKTGGLYEKNWKSPEDLAIESRNAGEQIAGSPVPPGKTAHIGPVMGKFTPHSQAILRIYLGEHNFSDLLAMSHGAPDRRDYELTAGSTPNDFRIVNRNGEILVVRPEAPVSMSTGSMSTDGAK